MAGVPSILSRVATTPPFGSCSAEVEVELAGGVGEGGLERELAAGGVEPGDVDRGVERAAGELERPRGRELGGLAEDRLLEADGREGELAQPHRDRQLRQREGLRLGASAACAPAPARWRGGSQVTRSALSRFTSTRPRSSARRFQSTSALSICEPDALAGRRW